MEWNGAHCTLTPSPYLCISADIEVTPGNLKSNAGIGYPSSQPCVYDIIDIHNNISNTSILLSYNESI